jgi:hypothetical protein
MRVWLIRPDLLDNNRVLGAHNEVHMAFGLLRRSAESGKLHTLVADWYSEVGIAALVHYHDLLVREMEVRGWYGHQTPVRWWELPEPLPSMFKAGRIYLRTAKGGWPPVGLFSDLAERVERDYKDLKERWRKEDERS